MPEDQRQGGGLLQTLLGGVEAVERELVKMLKEHNIERIDPAGEPFDPNFHEAMFEVPDSEFPSGTVAHVVQPALGFPFVNHGIVSTDCGNDGDDIASPLTFRYEILYKYVTGEYR